MILMTVITMKLWMRMMVCSDDDNDNDNVDRDEMMMMISRSGH